ncbi:hypothetical protein SAMN05192583_2440 [Sphingomonas gellani]|uniref:Uncharacterized protein n=1 Tax=Sphingomonas gellani TaxID=1166340 RepID=A0A1H8F753_9SPHN|nr:hypothetical protein [Sphingomonas gellani]SEN27470.1 hypothetical protein SAMN05192583_2440 [Sphingomonas gellani]
MMVQPVRGRDAVAQISRALVACAGRSGLAAHVEEASGRTWASATFVGTRVTITLVAPRAPTLGRWIADLPRADIPMRGQLLASLAIDRIEDDGASVRTDLTALVIEE